MEWRRFRGVPARVRRRRTPQGFWSSKIMLRRLLLLIAEMIQREIKDPRVGEISITHVVVSGDLGVATLRFLPLGGIGDAVAAQKGLTKASDSTQRQMDIVKLNANMIKTLLSP